MSLTEFKAGLHAYKYCEQPMKKGIAFLRKYAFKRASVASPSMAEVADKLEELM